jgi:hypothetical protein
MEGMGGDTVDGLDKAFGWRVTVKEGPGLVPALSIFRVCALPI